MTAAYRDEDGKPCELHPGCGCHPDCGLHPAGCFYGGFTRATSYWIIADGCQLEHPAPVEPFFMTKVP